MLLSPTNFRQHLIRCDFRPMRLLITAFCIAITSAAFGQSVIMRSLPLRLTVPVGVQYTNSATVTIIASGLTEGVDSINLTTTGALPPGAVATLDVTSFNTNGTITATLFWTNPPLASAGDYDLAIEASGAASYRLPIPIHVAYVWGGVAFTNSSNPNWSAAGNWQGGVIPSATDPVVFGDAGGQAGAPSPTNVVISASTEVARLRFANSESATRAHNIEINNNATLRVSGSDLSFSLLRDSKNIGNPLLATFSGNGSLIVSNPAASIGVLVDNQQQATWDMRNLNRFEADVVRIGLGDYRVYPNYYTNGYTSINNSGATGRPSRFIPIVYLAKTNIIKCSLVDPFDYNNDGSRDYALMIASSEAGSTTAVRLSLGLHNEFYLDSICWTGERNGGTSTYNFNSANSYALFRGIDGGRMSVWAQGDASGPGVAGSNVRGRDVNFSNGKVDALIDRLYLTRSSTNSSGATIQGVLTIGGNYPGSIFDVNTAYIGNQDVLNLHDPSGIEDRTFGNTFGNLIVQSNAVFKVNGDLHLAYTVASNPGLPDQPEDVQGRLNINNSGILMANNIAAGRFSSSEIVMTAGGNLIVTNGIGTSELPLTILDMNNSILTVFPDAATNAPCVFVKTLLTGGTGNTLKLGSLTGVTTFPVTIPVISYEGSAAPNFSLELPPGLYGYVVNNADNHTVDAVITDQAPKNVVWNGTPGNAWNTSAANWQGGLLFINGDSATFDDSAAGSTTVDIEGTIIPGSGGILISNETKAYTLTGGTISGTGVMTKEGAANLTVEANSEIALVLNEGSLTGSGALGAVTAASGTTVDFSGTMTRLTTAGNSKNSGNILQGLTVSGGTFDNSGTVGGVVNITGGAVTNNGEITATGVSTVAAGALLVQNGQFNAGTANVNSRLSVSGTVIGSGVFTDTTADGNVNNGRFSVESGGVLSPGNGPGDIAVFTIQGRFDLNPNARLIIEVDQNHPQINDIVAVDKWSNTRGIIQMTNIGAVPFAVGQSFHVISNNFNQPNTPEAASDFQIDPRSPGVGMQWDVSNLKTNGILAIIAAPTEPPVITNVFTTTNITLSWPTNYLGWQLQVQTNDLDTGLTDNWYSVPGSEGTSQQVWPIDPANPAVFFRLHTVAPTP